MRTLFIIAALVLSLAVSNAANFPFIRLNGKTNVVSDNGTNLTYNGSPLAGGSGSSTNTLLSLTPASPQSIAFSVTNGITQWLVATGTVTITSASLSAGAAFTLNIDNNQATNINVILPTGWRLISGARTNILAASSIGILSGFSRSSADTNVVALWASE